MFKTIYNASEKEWSGLAPLTLFDKNGSLGNTIHYILQRNPNKIGQISDNNGIQLTNQQILSKSIRLAQHLRLMHLNGDDIIGIIATNNHNVAPVVFGAFMAAVPVSTLDPTFGKADVSHMFRKTQPKLVFCEHHNIDIVRQAIADVGINPILFTMQKEVEGARFVEELFSATEEREKDFRATLITNGETTTATILCSSGTTGLSKGVRITHAQILQNLVQLWPVNEDDVFLCFSSLYWLSGMGMLIFGTINGVTRIITTEPFSAELMLHTIEKYRVTNIMSPPSQLAAIINCKAIETADISSVINWLSGGSQVPAILSETIQKYLPNGLLIIAYGLTEIGGTCSITYPNVRHGSVGFLRDGNKIRIIDDYGQFLGPGENGEILIKTLHTFQGYINDDDATKDILDDDNWLHTGDIGHFDEEGNLFIRDRKKDIIKYNNYQISPSEIEAIILAHAAVETVCVFGVPDLAATDLPAAAIVKRDGYQLAEQEIIDLVEANGVDFRRLRGGVYFMDKLPMTPSGKVQRKKVKEIILELLATKH